MAIVALATGWLMIERRTAPVVAPGVAAQAVQAVLDGRPVLDGR
ncbi:MAG: hypothetical protein ABIY55_00865 [Kofleriaceae bacterium]